MSTYAARVLETSTTTGTGNFTTAGAVTGYRTFNTALGQNITTDYVIEGVDASGIPTGEWEEGEGYMSSSTTLVRATPSSGSAATPVNFSAGTKRVFISFGADDIISKNKVLAYSMKWAMP